MNTLRFEIFDYAREKYAAEPEFPWLRLPDYAVLRHSDNRKWFGIVMDVPRDRLGLSGEERVDILNVKLPGAEDVLFYTSQPGILRGYHISRGNWISILLDGTVPLGEVKRLLDLGFRVTETQKKKKNF